MHLFLVIDPVASFQITLPSLKFSSRISLSNHSFTFALNKQLSVQTPQVSYVFIFQQSIQKLTFDKTLKTPNIFTLTVKDSLKVRKLLSSPFFLKFQFDFLRISLLVSTVCSSTQFKISNQWLFKPKTCFEILKKWSHLKVSFPQVWTSLIQI